MRWVASGVEAVPLVGGLGRLEEGIHYLLIVIRHLLLVIYEDTRTHSDTVRLKHSHPLSFDESVGHAG